MRSLDGRVGWRAANNMLPLPPPRVAAHTDDVHYSGLEWRTYHDCTTSPISRREEVAQRTCDETSQARRYSS
jgi:hypothetical protein